jgi:hypothetical protein
MPFNADLEHLVVITTGSLPWNFMVLIAIYMSWFGGTLLPQELVILHLPYQQ